MFFERPDNTLDHCSFHHRVHVQELAGQHLHVEQNIATTIKHFQQHQQLYTIVHKNATVYSC